RRSELDFMDFFFSSRRRHTRSKRDWSSDVCSSDLKQKEEPDRGRDVQKKVDLQDIFRNAFYPLTLPLTVGPGSISVAITLGANLTHPLRTNLSAILATLIGSGVVAATIYVCYGFADRMAAVIVGSGMGIVMLLFFLLLLCIV